MRKKILSKILLLAGVISLSVSAFANDTITETDEKNVDFANGNNNDCDDKRTLIPVTASISNEVLTVRFIVSVADATIEVSDALTQSIISQESMAAPAGTCYNYSLTELPEGIYTVSVTNNTNGETVSGEFEISQSKE